MSKKKIKLIFQKDYYWLTRELIPILLGIAAVGLVGFYIMREIYTVGCFSSYKITKNFDGPSFSQCRELFTK